MADLWGELHELFETDDGSLPDIFVENLSNLDVQNIYCWVRSQSEVFGDPSLWDRVEQRGIPIKNIENPVSLVLVGRVEPFRDGLAGLSVSGIELPQLTIAVYSNEIQFDYRMGSEWGPSQVEGLFEFLLAIQIIAPDAMLSHAQEGGYPKRTRSFASSWHIFKQEKLSK
jgi:hypothetical protein